MRGFRRGRCIAAALIWLVCGTMAAGAETVLPQMRSFSAAAKSFEQLELKLPFPGTQAVEALTPQPSVAEQPELQPSVAEQPEPQPSVAEQPELQPSVPGLAALELPAPEQPELQPSVPELSVPETPLPGRWYAGDHGRKPVVQYQGKYGTCWALAAVSALEASLLPEQHLVFSADHMARNNAFTVDLEDGGDYLMTMAYLSGWQGPVTVEDDPYGDGISPQGLSPVVHVQEIQVLRDADPGQIKEAVRRYGAVQTSLYMSPEMASADTPGRSFYYNLISRAYYYPEEKTPNHDVIILGWDDNFPGFLFPAAPGADGAFICQNTWEGGFGEDGIFYVSYADPNIARTAIFYSGIEPADNYDRIYQNDDCGWQGRQGYGSGTCWFSNVYTAEADESLAAAGFYATDTDTSYEIYYVEDFSGPDSFRRMKYLQSGNLQNTGYYTIRLEAPQALAAGERFAVAVKITTPKTGNPVAVEYRADQYTQNVTTEGREGYLSRTGEYWENTEEKFGTNVCLKAYTRR